VHVVSLERFPFGTSVASAHQNTHDGVGYYRGRRHRSIPIIWNIIARNEYRNKTLTRFFGGKYQGCYALAAWIFFSSLGKDYLFSLAVDANPVPQITRSATQQDALYLLGTGCIGFGSVLVLSSYYRLGITGTYLGDYFGIYMNSRITALPLQRLREPDVPRLDAQLPRPRSA
jgi:hypothetical protein